MKNSVLTRSGVMMNLSSSERKALFTGTQVAYYFLCRRKLWLFSRGLGMESTSELVNLGRVIDEFSFRREYKGEFFSDEPIKVDFLRISNGIVVHEVKKSSKMEEVHEWQVKYYIWYLSRKGVSVREGVIHYPRAFRMKKVVFTEKDARLIEEALKGIKDVLSLPEPPPPRRTKICSKCAYFEFCFVR